LQGGAADRFGQAQVFVFGVDHGDLHPVVQRPEHFEFDQVGLAGAGAGNDDGVVVVLGPAVPPDDAGGVGVEPVQHPAGRHALTGQRRGQVGGGQGEGGGEGVGVEHAPHPQGVGRERQGRGPALQLAPGRRLGVQQHRGGGGADLRDGLDELVGGHRVHRQIQPDPEQPGLAAGEPVGEVGGVLGGSVGNRVTEASLVRVETPGRFQAGALAAQPAGGIRGGHGFDVDRHVETAGPGQQRFEPGGADLSRVAGHDQGGGIAVPDLHVTRADLHAGGADGRAQVGAAGVLPGRRIAPLALSGEAGGHWGLPSVVVTGSSGRARGQLESPYW